MKMVLRKNYELGILQKTRGEWDGAGATLCLFDMPH